jgi:hypothetical protein
MISLICDKAEREVSRLGVLSALPTFPLLCALVSLCDEF